MRTLHLFAGAGGGLLADLILGHDPVAAVEWDPYCCAVLRERATEGWFPNLQVWEGDIRMFDASAWKGRVDCVSAGFPCQPHSVAGKRRGAVDDRNLWPEVVRCLREIRPPWVFLENVPGIVSNGFIGTVLGDLAGLGYDARWTVLGADRVGAPHRRDRWWCLAYANGIASKVQGNDFADAGEGGSGSGGRGRGRGNDRWKFEAEKDGNVADSKSGTRQRETPREAGHAPFSRQDVPNANGEGWPESTRGQFGSVQKEDGTPARSQSGGDDSTSERWDWWDIEPDLGRISNGVASRVDRLKGLGNGQVPPCAAAAWIILGGPSDTF